MNTNRPYEQLNPDLILDAIESVGFRSNGSLLQLNSYENRVYQVGIEDASPLIVKFYRPNRWSNAAILEEHAFATELAQHDIPVIAPLKTTSLSTLNTFKDFRFALFPSEGGRPLELDNLEQLEWVGRVVGRLHAVGACKPFQHRITLDIDSYGKKPYQFLKDHHFIPTDLEHNYSLVLDDVLLQVQQLIKEVGDVTILRLHGDCHGGNILWDQRGPKIVDMDDCLMGPSVQDIWMLLSAYHQHEFDMQLTSFLKGYQEFYDFNYRELYLVEALRALRMIHYSAWIAKRWQDPAFPLNFPWFATPRYWQEQIDHFREQSYKLTQALENLREAC